MHNLYFRHKLKASSQQEVCTDLDTQEVDLDWVELERELCPELDKMEMDNLVEVGLDLVKLEFSHKEEPGGSSSSKIKEIRIKNI